MVEKIPEETRKKDIKEILEGRYTEEEVAKLGKNRGQLFVRIPKVVEKRMDLKEGDYVVFRVYNGKGDKPQLEIGVNYEKA